MTVATRKLNDQQRQAVEHVLGPLLVLAPVGTGKTTVLAHRAAHAIGTGLDPSQVLCLSFTNRAAREMKDRAVALLGPKASALRVGTFHGFCTRVLRCEAGQIGLPTDFTICDEVDTQDALLNLCERQGVTLPREGRLPQNLAQIIKRMKEARGREETFNLDEMLRVLEEVEPSASGEVRRLDVGRLLNDYDEFLAAGGALDFDDLIWNVEALFRRRPDRLRHWQQLHPWVQVDEVQDTSLREYRILLGLAAESRNLAFLGDIDQTIYEWRGSNPYRMLDEFRRAFAPVREIALTRNYRSSPTLLKASLAHLQSLPDVRTATLDSAEERGGRRVVVHEEETPEDEGRWIAGVIAQLARDNNVGLRDIAVLTRSNALAASLSRTLDREKVPVFLIDRKRFWVQPEIKDALAHVRLLLNPRDGSSLLRVLYCPCHGLDPRHIDEVRRLPTTAGLKLIDLLTPAENGECDPFAPLFHAIDEGRAVVFDTETTGLEQARDDVIELAALKVGPDGPGESFHALLRTDRSLDESSAIHGITADMLDRDGRDPREVLAEFLSFIDGCVLIGHNAGFDENILRSQMRRLGLTWPSHLRTFDTLDLCRRFLSLPSYSLGDVCRDLGIAATPTHRAMDDVRATAGLLERLLPHLQPTRAERERLMGSHRETFHIVAERLAQWRRRMDADPPIVLLNRVLDDSGLLDYWRGQPAGPRRLATLHELGALFEAHADRALSPREALLELIHLAALGNDLDRHTEKEDRVFLLTVHQAKGLEFDTVFIAGATDREFPSAMSIAEGRLAEEHRLFYVAMTRARRRLFVTYHRRQENSDRLLARTRFLESIPPALLRPI